MTERPSIKSPRRERVKLTPEAEEAYYRYKRGFLEGDLEPLADYLAAGHPLDHALRITLIKAIEGLAGDGVYRLELARNDGRPGEGTPGSEFETKFRDLRIKQFVDDQLSASEVKTDSAVKAAETRFGVGKSTVYAARKRFRKEDSSS